MSGILSELAERGCTHDVSHVEALEELLKEKQIEFYCGFDPTSDSLHVGSMLPLILMERLQSAGHRPTVVLGTATGMIGDPSGKSEERNLISFDTIQENAAGIENQIAQFLSATGKNSYQVLRNDSWLKKLNLIEFLRDVGKHFSVNQMIAKDSVKTRLEERDQGISYTEFSYMALQAYDYFHLNKTIGCRLQVGGSDQWGNITAGMDLIRKLNPSDHPSVYGLTFPLLTTSSGTKFGKTEKGAVWLDAEKTSPYEFYQYWLNTADTDVGSYLNLFTSISKSELKDLETQVREHPQEREAQKKLAESLTLLVHGETALKTAKQASRILFGEAFDGIDSKTLLNIFQDVPSQVLGSDSLSRGMSLSELLVHAKAAKSKGEARRLIEGGGVYLNNERRSDPKLEVSSADFVDKQVLVLRTGKKKFFLVCLQ